MDLELDKVSTFIVVVLEVLGKAISWEREIKRIQSAKAGVELTLPEDVMILFIEKPKDSTKRLL